MRIGLFIDTGNLGGAESVVAALARALVAGGHEAIVYHFGNDFLEQAAAQGGFACRIAPDHARYKRTLRTLGFARPFSRMLERDGIDLLHSHLSGAIFGGGIASRLAGIPHVGTLHDVYVVQERPVRAYLLKCVAALGTTLVCVSDEMADYYAGVMRTDRARFEVIRNGVDVARYRDARRAADTHENAVTLIMVGRLDAIKRHDLALEALARLPDDRRWRARIVGDGPVRVSLEAEIAARGLEDRVALLGQRSDVPELLAGADVFLLISDSEGMSLSLIEALASGLPVIATRVGNNAKLVTDGWNGLLIDPGDAAALAAALETLIGDPDLRARYAAHSVERADATLDFSATMQRYVSLYRRLLAT